MAVDPIQLLKQLEPAVRPGAAPAPGRSPQAPLERRSFDELLALVSRGSMHSGRPVTIDEAASLKAELEGDQLPRLAAAADRAEAAGAQRAVMLIDGRGLVMDVADRIVTAELGAGRGGHLVDIDAAVYVAGEADEAEAGSSASGPVAGVLPPGVARQIEQAGAHRTQRNDSPGAPVARAAG